jgi:hypothetical protein
MMVDTAVPHVHEDEDRVDSCLCGVKFNESDAVSDTDLPPAAGGVQAAVDKHDNEDGVDGCNVDFNGNDVTTDRELPVASGGVA